MLDLKSAHYEKWLTSIPYGQFICLRKNCTLKDFNTQSKIMENRFKEKHYSKQIIKSESLKLRLLETKATKEKTCTR